MNNECEPSLYFDREIYIPATNRATDEYFNKLKKLKYRDMLIIHLGIWHIYEAFNYYAWND